jgi:hypothetical protein
MMAVSAGEPRPRVMITEITGVMVAGRMGSLSSARMMGMRTRGSGGGGDSKQHASRANAQCD